MCFSDYARPSMRLASLMGIRSIFVMTHDSIGLGEDGPTHQPVEHLGGAARHSQPQCLPSGRRVMEAAECWQLALQTERTPSTLALTRRNLPAVRTEFVAENLAPGAPGELAAAEGGDAAVTVFASGSEVEIALGARKLLQGHGHPTRVVSVPCMDIFRPAGRCLPAQDDRRRTGQGRHRGWHPPGWDHLIGIDGIFVGMTGFGASGTIEQLYPHFGIRRKPRPRRPRRDCTPGSRQGNAAAAIWVYQR